MDIIYRMYFLYKMHLNNKSNTKIEFQPKTNILFPQLDSINFKYVNFRPRTYIPYNFIAYDKSKLISMCLASNYLYDKPSQYKMNQNLFMKSSSLKPFYKPSEPDFSVLGFVVVGAGICGMINWLNK